MTPKRLPDPRLYPSANVSNRLIHLALSVLGIEDESARELEQIALCDVMADLLARNEILLISVALNMAPSREAYQVLWQALRQAVEAAPGRHAEIFALPLVLVAGSRQPATLPDHIADVDGLNAILQQHGVFAPGAEVFLSGKLLHPDSVVAISPAQLYRYTRQLADAARGLPLLLEGRSVTVREEGVFLRYLVGVAIREADGMVPVDYSARIGAWGTAMMKFLSDALKTEGVTFFPVFRAPAPLMQAIVVGNQVRLEVALQVFISSLLRKLRSEGREPVISLSAHRSGEVHVSVSTADAANGQGERFIWPLAPLDRVERIELDFLLLMRECQVEMVRIEETVQP